MEKVKYDFLDPNNDCGMTALRISAEGSVIIAEIQRLSKYIPQVYLPEDSYEQKIYSPVIFDCTYIDRAEDYEDQIQNNVELIELDENFRESYIEIIERFYQLYTSIFHYYQDFIKYLDNIRAGFFLEYTLESILLQRDGKQLLCECMYNFGVMLLLLDRLIPAYSRERILVSYYRYKGQSAIENVKDIFLLCKNTGYNPASVFPKQYPVKYFERFGFNKTPYKEVVENLIEQIKSDDIYQQLNSYPSSHHRSVALAQQASMIFVCSFFCPNLLNEEHTKMREIVDKHFYDNWIIPIYQGYLVDITQYWGGFEASKKALNNNVVEPIVAKTAMNYQIKVKSLRKELRLYLKEGKLLDDYVLDNVQPLLECLRECNITIRWLLLHRNCRDKHLRAIIEANHTTEDILDLLLSTSKFEKELKELFQELVKSKNSVWTKDKGECVYYMNEIAEYFAGNRNMGKQYIDENYSNWFKQIGERIENLNYKHSTVAGRTIKSIIQALDDIEIYEPVETNVQIKHFIQETKKCLLHMVRSVNVKKSYLVNISHISDFSYAWNVIDDYLDQIQSRIKEKPRTVLLIKTLFMKLASIMNLPLGRMMEANSEDIENIATYYSNQLVKFVKNVLQVIPTSIFANLEEISEILTSKIKEFPVKLSKEELKEYTEFENRYKLAKLTHKISVYTEGILCLDKALMGVIQVDPKEILVEGIRRELVKTVSKLLHHLFIFSTKGDSSELQSKLNTLKSKFKGLKKSFEYIQDFLNIPGEQIWREEVTRIFRVNLNKEGIKLINDKYDANNDPNQGIKIPQFPIVENDPSPTFLGRLLNQLCSILAPSNVLYLDQVSNFYSTTTGQQVFGLRNVVSLEKDIGIIFLQSLDQMISYRIVNDTKKFIRDYGMTIGGGGFTKDSGSKSGNRIDSYTNTLKQFERSIPDFYTATEAQYKGYQVLIENFKPIYSKLITNMLNIGQLQLIRRIVLSHLNFVAKMETPYFYSCLSNLNTATFNCMELLKTKAKDIKEDVIVEIPEELDSDDSHYEEKKKAMDLKKKHGDQNFYQNDADETKGDKILKKLLSDLSTVLETSGFLEPIHKVYVLAKDLDYMALSMLLLTLTAASNLHYDLNVNSLVRKTKSANIDGPCFVMGLITIFKQFHNSHFKKFLVYMSHYIKSSIEVSKDKGSLQKLGQYPQDVTVCFGILEEILRFGKYDREVIKQVLGVNFLFDNFKNVTYSDKK